MATLLEQLGGREAIELVVAGFYERVLSDSLLKPYFRGVQMSRLYKNQADYFCMALGDDPSVYRGRDMRSLHAGMNIGDAEFDAVANHLAATLAEVEVPPALIEAVLGRIAPLRPEIVTRTASPRVTMQQLFYSVPAAKGAAAATCPLHGAQQLSRWLWPLFTLALLAMLVTGIVVWRTTIPY